MRSAIASILVVCAASTPALAQADRLIEACMAIRNGPPDLRKLEVVAKGRDGRHVAILLADATGNTTIDCYFVDDQTPVPKLVLLTATLSHGRVIDIGQRDGLEAAQALIDKHFTDR